MKVGKTQEDPLSQLDPSKGLLLQWTRLAEIIKAGGKLRAMEVAELLMRERQAILLSLCMTQTLHEQDVWQEMLRGSEGRVDGFIKILEEKNHEKTVKYIKERLQEDFLSVVSVEAVGSNEKA